MFVRMQLSRVSDPDLFDLYERLGSQRFMVFTKECLRASMMGKVGRLAYLPPLINPVEDNTVLLTISLQSKKDKALLDLLEKRPSKSRTGYIKTVLRLNLGLSFIRDRFLNIDSDIAQAKPIVVEVEKKEIVNRRVPVNTVVQPMESVPVSTPTPVSEVIQSIPTVTPVTPASTTIQETSSPVPSVTIVSEEPISTVNEAQNVDSDDEIDDLLAGLIDD